MLFFFYFYITESNRRNAGGPFAVVLSLGMFKAAQLDLQLKPQLNPNSVINNFPISQFGQSWGSSSGRSFEHFLFSNYFILNSYLNFTT